MAADPLPTVPGPALPAGPATMLELGAALGADVWWLEQLFALAGGWVESEPEASIRIHLAELSRVLGDHAQSLRGLLPRPAPVDPDRWVVPPYDDAPAMLAELAEVGGVQRLAAMHRVLLTRLLVAWDAPLGPSAASVGRALRHARTDLAELRDEGEALLQALLAEDRRHLSSVWAATSETEAGVVGGGGMRPVAPSTPPV